MFRINTKKHLRNALVGISPTFFGYAFIKAWSLVSIPYFSVSGEGIWLPANLTLLPFNSLFALFACVLALFSVRIVPEQLRRVLFPLSTAFLIASTAILCAASIDPALGDRMLPAAIALGAFGSIGMSVLWIDFYSLFSPLRALLLNAGAIAISLVFVYVIVDSPRPKLFVILMGMVVLGAFCFETSWRKTGDRPAAHIGLVKTTFPYKAAIFVAAYSFAYGLASPYVAIIEGSTEFRLIPVLIVLAGSFLDMKRADAKMLYNIAFPTMVCGMLVVSLIPGLSPSLSFFLLDSSYTAMSMLVAVVACGISYALGTSASWIFGLLVTVQFAARSLGQLCNFLLGASGYLPLLHEAVSILAVMSIVVASLVMASEKGLFANWGSHQTDPEAVTNKFGGVPFIQMRIDSLSDTYGLTQRETDVIRLLADGKSNSVIANEMFIAVGTVKAHIQHVYQKLGIHTRKELFELIGKDGDKEAR